VAPCGERRLDITFLTRLDQWFNQLCAKRTKIDQEETKKTKKEPEKSSLSSFLLGRFSV
jgi:hypothetical protein